MLFLDCEQLDYYDKLYKYNGPLQLNTQLDCIKLLHDVECKSTAYKDAFKSPKPIHFVRKLMYGIYGYEDLLTRCQKDEVESGDLVPMCNKKNEAVEQELYRFLRLNNYNVHLIKMELQDIDKYYHNAISCAKLKNKRLKKAEELRLLEQQVQGIGQSILENNATNN